MAAGRFGLRKRRQPGAVPSHLLCIGRDRERCEHRAVMRRSDRDDMLHARDSIVPREPGTDRQTAHAVGDDDRRMPGCRLNAPHSRVDRSGIAVDAAEYRLEIDGDKRKAEVSQPAQPPVPEAAIADEAMDKDDSCPRRIGRRQAIGNSVRTKRLIPVESPGGRPELSPPRVEQHRRVRRGNTFLAIDPRHEKELGRQYDGVSKCNDQRTGNRKHEFASDRMQNHPCKREHDQRECDRLLESGEHRVGFGESGGSGFAV